MQIRTMQPARVLSLLMHVVSQIIAVVSVTVEQLLPLARIKKLEYTLG